MTKHVVVKPSGHQFNVEDDEPVLEAALRGGLAFPYSCRDGACGTCKSRLLSGAVRYPDDRLPPALKEEERAQGLHLLCQARALTDLEIEVTEVSAIEGIPIRMLPSRVARMEKLAHDVMRLILNLPKNEPLRFLAGQYVDVIMRDGKRRSFSIANAPHENSFLELHIRHVPGGAFSGFVFEHLKEKDILRLKGPMGTFFLREESSRPILLLAGGTGFAPIKALIEHAIHIGLQRPMHLYWGARARRDIYLPDLPRDFEHRHPAFRYTPVLSEPQAEDHWQGRTGFVTQAVAQDYQDLTQYDVYACGPPQMILSGKQMFTPLGLPPSQFYHDSFEYAKS